MNKSTLSAICFLMCWGSAAFAQTTNREISAFLETTYGIIYKPTSSFLKSDWECPSGRMARKSGNTTRNWVCVRRDPSYMRQVIWRDGDERTRQVQNEHFTAMAGGKDAEHGDPSCNDSAYSVNDGKIQGLIRDCKLPLANGEFFASFFHFKHRDTFITLSVRNASSTGSTSKVANDLREWIADLKFVE